MKKILIIVLGLCFYSCQKSDDKCGQIIQKEIMALHLTDEVSLTGILDRKKLVDLLNESDIFVMPSIENKAGGQDGIPNAMIEAMAVKIPVVTTDAGAILEVITHGFTGILTEQRSPDSLCMHIAKIINHEYEMNSILENAYIMVEKEFDREICVKKIGEIILKLRREGQIWMESR